MLKKIISYYSWFTLKTTDIQLLKLYLFKISSEMEVYSVSKKAVGIS